MIPAETSQIELDGSQGEGGGSILRVGAGLACVIHRPLKVTNIRKNRDVPGLRTQHLIGIQALQQLTHGDLTDVEVGTTELEFSPGMDWQPNIELTIPTAGNIGLLMQTLHNALYCAPIDQCTIHIQGGGTYGIAAPGCAYLQNVTYPLFKKIGYSVELDVIDHGFYPKGGAQAKVVIRPNPSGYEGLILEERGTLEKVQGCIIVEQQLQNARVGERILESIQTSISPELLQNVPLDIQIAYPSSPSVGVGVDLWCSYSSGAILGVGTILGEKKVSSEKVGKHVSLKLIELLKSESTVDEYASDQLLPLLALAEGPSRIRLDVCSSHFTTNLAIIERFIPRESRITKLDSGFLFEYL